MSSHYIPINTFSRSPSVPQICSYLVVALQTVIFYVMIQPSIQSSTARLVFIILYSCSVAAVVITTTICSCIDPSDSILIDYRNGNKNKMSSQSQLFCDYCQSFVEASSKHCRQCNRCVTKFDHHCIWINNCVGKKNYKVFIAMLLSTFSNMVIFMASVIYLSVERNWHKFLGFMITSWVVLVIVGILSFMLLNLILLHVYLKFKGYTTYEFVIARREQEKDEEMKKMEKQLQQRREIKKAALRNIKNKATEQNEGGDASQAQRQLIKVQSKVEIEESKSNSMLDLGLKAVSNRNQSAKKNNNKNDRTIFDENVQDSNPSTPTAQRKKGKDEKQDLDSNNTTHINRYFIKNKSLKILVPDNVSAHPSLKKSQHENEKKPNKKETKKL